MEQKNKPILTEQELAERMTSFLDYPYNIKIEQGKQYSSFFKESLNLEILQSKSQQEIKNIYESMLDYKKEEILPLKTGKDQSAINIEPSLLTSTPETLKENYNSVYDIKKKEDELQTMILNNEGSSSIMSSGGGNNNSNSSVVNNNSYITNIVPDYILAIKRKSQSPPGWRDSAG